MIGKSSLSVQSQILGLIACMALSFFIATLGAIASIQAREFYAALDTPSWAPPGWVFGPVWTSLFIMMALSAWLVWRVGGYQKATLALRLFLVQMLFNALWSWLFFAWNLGLLAVVEVLVLWALILATLVSFWRINKLAALLLLPYWLWVSFASVLTYNCWVLNPQLL